MTRPSGGIGIYWLAGNSVFSKYLVVFVIRFIDLLLRICRGVFFFLDEDFGGRGGDELGRTLAH